MDLSIIIVNWNSREYLQTCVRAVLARTRLTSFEIIVVDCGSFDGCDRMLRECYPNVRFIQLDANIGFARANNRAAREAKGKTLLFLNPDTEVTYSALDRLYEAIQALPAAGAVGCRLLNANGSVQTSCIQATPTILNQLLNCEFLRRHTPASRL